MSGFFGAGGSLGAATSIALKLLANVTVTNVGSPYLLLWDVEVYKNGIGHSNSSNKSRIIAQIAGKYHLSGVIPASCTSGSYHYLSLLVNGVVQTTINLTPGAASAAGYLPFSCDVNLAANDYVKLSYTTSDGTNQTLYGGDTNSIATMHYVGT